MDSDPPYESSSLKGIILFLQAGRHPCPQPQGRTAAVVRGYHRHPPVLQAAQEAGAHLQGHDSRRGKGFKDVKIFVLF